MRWFLTACLLLPVTLHASRGEGLRGLSAGKISLTRYDTLRAFEQMAKSGTLPGNALELLPGLQSTGMLADMAHFNPLAKPGGGSVFQALVDGLRQRGTDYSDLLEAALEKEKQHLGAALLLGVMTPFAPDLGLLLEPAAPAFAKLGRQRQKDILQALRQVWPDLETQLLSRAGKTMAPFAEALRLDAETKLKGMLDRDDMGPSHTTWEDQIVETCVELLAHDVEMAARLLEHAAKRVTSTQQAGDWKGRSYVNGFNVPSALLESVGKKCAGTVALRFYVLCARLCSPPHQRDFLYPSPVDALAVHELFLRHQGMADPRAATQAVLNELKQVFNKQDPSTLFFVFHSWSGKLSRWHEAIVRSEAARLAARKGPLQPLARELVTGLGLRQRGPLSQQHVRERMADLQTNPLLVAQYAGLLCGSMNDGFAASDLCVCMDAVLPLLEHDWPVSGALWERFLPTLNRTAKDALWDAQVKRLRQAWLNRARHQKLGNLPWWQRFSLNTTTALHAMETFARSGHEADLVTFADNYRMAYRTTTSARLILARHRCTNELKQVMAYANGVATVVDDTSGIAFRDDDAVVFDWLAQTLSDPAQCLMARVQISQVRDSNWQSPAINREARMAREATSLLRLADPKPAMMKHLQELLLESFSAARVLAPAVLKTTLIENEWKAALPDHGAAFQRSKMLRRPLTLALAAMANGDAQPWQRSLDWLKGHLEAVADKPPLLRDLSYRTATVCVWHARDQGVPRSPWMRQVMSDVVNLLPEGLPLSHAEEVVMTRLGFDCFRDSMAVTPEKEAQRSLWLLYALHVPALNDGESGMNLLLRALKNEAVRSSLRQAEDLSYQGRMPQRWSDEVLRQNTVALLQADVGNPAVMLSILNAWSDAKDRSPLLISLRSIQPKLDPVRDAKALTLIASVERETDPKHSGK
jgi:hypothetical protein